MERLDLNGKSHSFNSTVFHTYSGINVTSLTVPYYTYWSHDHYKYTYPLGNMFAVDEPNLNSIFASASAEGQLVFDLPTPVYVEYLRIYPYCGNGHSRYDNLEKILLHYYKNTVYLQVSLCILSV